MFPYPPGLALFGHYSEAMLRTTKRHVLAFFGWIERPAAWLLLAGAVITFVGVLIGWITVGDFKWPTLLIAADLMVSGFSAVQEAHDDDPRADNDPDT